MPKSIWKSLKSFLGMSLLAGSLMLPGVAKGAGRLEVSNAGKNVGGNYVRFVENGGNGSYVPYPFPPSVEIYYEDTNSNKYTATGVNLSTNKTYTCPLEYADTIPDGTSNSIAFKIVQEWPSNTLCTASIQTDSGFSTNITDVIAYTKANSNAQGYAGITLPNITNAVSGEKYGNVVMRFAPLYSITPTNNSGGTVSPSAKVFVPWGEGTNFNINATQPGSRIEAILTNNATAYTNSVNNNLMISTNFSWNNVNRDSNAFNVVFGPKKYNLSVLTAYGTPNPGTTNNVPHGTVVTQSIESVVNGTPGTRYINKGSSLKTN